MAESQDSFEYSAANLATIERALSSARLAPYYAIAQGDREFALQHYLWNARLAKAFLFPLQVAEVVTRNTMYNSLAAIHGPDWLTAQPFALAPESALSLSRALARLPANPMPDEIVAALTFDFWSNLFRKHYDPVWDAAALALTFPDAQGGVTRRQVQQLVAPINRLRNRIAHHEPIHQMAHRQELSRILELIGYCSTPVHDWTEKHTTVMAIVRSPPTSASSRPGRPLVATNLRPPPLVQLSDSLLAIVETVSKARPALALVQSANALEVLTVSRLSSYIADKSIADGGMIDLSDHTVDMLLAATDPIATKTVPKDGSTGDATLLFFPPGKAKNRPQVILVLDDEGKVVGALQRPDIRY